MPVNVIYYVATICFKKKKVKEQNDAPVVCSLWIQTTATAND